MIYVLGIVVVSLIIVYLIVKKKSLFSMSVLLSYMETKLFQYHRDCS